MTKTTFISENPPDIFTKSNLLRKTSLVENHSDNQSSRKNSKSKSLPNDVVMNEEYATSNSMNVDDNSCSKASIQFSQLHTENDTEPNYFNSHFNTPLDEDR